MSCDRITFEERAAIMEFDGNMTREDAELLAELFTDDSDSAEPCRCAICEAGRSNPH